LQASSKRKKKKKVNPISTVSGETDPEKVNGKGKRLREGVDLAKFHFSMAHELEGCDSKIKIEKAFDEKKYKVMKLDNPLEREETINDDEKMPVHPFFMLLVGPRKMGKSNCLIDFLTNKVPPDFFDLILVYCKTYEDDAKWWPLLQNINSEFIHKELHPDKLAFEYSTIEKIILDNPKFRTLIIFDDMISDNIASRFNIDIVGKLAVMGRHKGISVCFTTQLFRALGTAIRTNATNILVFQQGNSLELDKISEEARGALSKKDFLKLYNFVFSDTQEKAFLHINRDRPLQLRFTKGWGQQILVDATGGMNMEGGSGCGKKSEKEESSDSEPEKE